MKYFHVVPVTRAEAERAFASGDPTRIVAALLGIAYHDPDWEWVQEKCIGFAGDPRPNCRQVAALCFGHLARIHGKLDTTRVGPVLDKLRCDSDRSVASAAATAAEDVVQFVGKP